MREYAETFKGYKITNVIFISTSLFSKEKFVIHFSDVIYTKMRPHASLQLFYDLRQMAAFLSFEIRFFEYNHFFLRSRLF